MNFISVQALGVQNASEWNLNCTWITTHSKGKYLGNGFLKNWSSSKQPKGRVPVVTSADPRKSKLPGLKYPSTPPQLRLVSWLWTLVSCPGGRRRRLLVHPTACGCVSCSLFHGSPAPIVSGGGIPQCHPSLSAECRPGVQFVRPSQEKKRLSSSGGLFSSTLKFH